MLFFTYSLDTVILLAKIIDISFYRLMNNVYRLSYCEC